jgi:hypothetical protein
MSLNKFLISSEHVDTHPGVNIAYFLSRASTPFHFSFGNQNAVEKQQLFLIANHLPPFIHFEFQHMDHSANLNR